jgi:23S rRNA pseudouridine2605 synthase
MLRLQKLLADAGIASRRKAEDIILAGRVKVDGRVVTRLGEKADPAQQTILVDGQPLKLQSKVYIILNKPVGPITSVADPFGRQVVMDLVREIPESVKPVGRLDADTEGLLLLTNDGPLAYRLTHARFGAEKVYHAEVQHSLSKSQLRQLREGIELEEGVTAPARAQMVPRTHGHPIVEIVIHTGWKRQIRRMLEALGQPVLRLKRVAFGPLQLGNLPVGKWRRLNPAEVKLLWRLVEHPVPRPQAAPRELDFTARTTRPAFKQDAQTRIRRGVPPTRARTR